MAKKPKRNNLAGAPRASFLLEPKCSRDHRENDCTCITLHVSWIISVPPSFERVVSTQTWHSIESLDQALIVAIESDDQVIVERQVRLGCCENKL